MNGTNHISQLVDKADKNISIIIVENGYVVKAHTPKGNFIEQYTKKMIAGMTQGMAEAEDPFQRILNDAKAEDEEKEIRTFVCKDIKEDLAVVSEFLETDFEDNQAKKRDS